MIARAVAVLCLVVMAVACKREPSSELGRRVEAALGTEGQLTRITVKEERGIVTLSGVVATDGDRANLREKARVVPGVVAVDDQLVVRPPPMLTGATPDAVLAAAIATRLRAADFGSLDVEVHDKTARVVGTVRSDRHADAMRIVVESVPRDYRVEDALAETALR